MADILQDFPIAASAARVYEAVSEPRLLDEWWTLRSSGRAAVGATYDLDGFGRALQDMDARRTLGKSVVLVR